MDVLHCPILEELSNIWKKTLEKRYGDGFFLINEAVGRLKLMANRFYELGLNDPTFTSEILSKEPYKYEQRMSEILFSDRLIRDGYKLSSDKEGPDFKAEKNGKVTWFEVITPSPVPKLEKQFKDPNYRLNPTQEGARLASYTTLLKTTAAVREKNKKIVTYINDGIISEGDATIIVINDSLFFPLDLPTIGLNCEIAEGCSGLPLIIEALMGIGQAHWIKNQSDNNHQIVRANNDFIINQNNSSVDTNRFRTDRYNSISGVFVLTLREDYGLAEVIYEHVKNKKNKGVFLTNPNTTRPFEPRDLSARHIEHKRLDELTRISDDNPVSCLMTKTVAGYLMELNSYLGYIRQLFIKAGVHVANETTNEVSISQKALEGVFGKYVVDYDEASGLPIGVSLLEE